MLHGSERITSVRGDTLVRPAGRWARVLRIAKDQRLDDDETVTETKQLRLKGSGREAVVEGPDPVPDRNVL